MSVAIKERVDRFELNMREAIYTSGGRSSAR